MPAVGVDVGGTKVLAVAVDDGGEVLGQKRVATPLSAESLLDAAAELVVALAPDERTPVGVGLPGLVDREGVLRFAPNLRGIVDLDVSGGLATRLGRKVAAVENDATCATWAEARLGAAAGFRHVVLATLGTGIGGGFVWNGRLERGTNGFAGELGHFVVDVDGPPCGCGKRGCWEQFASGTALGRLAAGVGMGDGEQVTAAAARGDAAAASLMEEYARWVALGLVNVAAILDPELFVIGGGLVEAGPVLFDPLRRAFAALVEGGERHPAVEILPAALGERAGALGAALLAAEA